MTNYASLWTVDGRLDELLRSVGEHSVASWPLDELTAALDIMFRVSDSVMAAAARRLVAREIKALIAARDVQLAAMGRAREVERGRRRAGGLDAGEAPL